MNALDEFDKLLLSLGIRYWGWMKPAAFYYKVIDVIDNLTDFNDPPRIGCI